MNFWEFVIQNVIQVIVLACFICFISWQNTHDVEVWNGRVASKSHYHVSCEHSYSCHCHEVCSGSGNNRSCYEHCDTCYEHWYDVDWAVKTTNDESLLISRIDRQGVNEPPRWASVQVGEPTAVSHSFVNYVKGAPDSLFRQQGLVEQYKDKIPAYPGQVYDYYHVNRFVNMANLPDAALWNKDLEEINATLGRAKQVNVIVVAVMNMPEDYFYAVEQAWVGGKKNDFTVMINIDSSGKITWTHVMAWTDNKMAEVVVADGVTKIGGLLGQREQILKEISAGIGQYFVRKHMKDFEYLSHKTKPTLGEWIAAMILGLTLSVGIGIVFLKNDFDF